MSDKYKHNSRPSNAMLYSYSRRRFRTRSPSDSLEPPSKRSKYPSTSARRERLRIHSPSQELLPKRSKSPNTTPRRESYLKSKEPTTSLSRLQNNQLESSSYPRELVDLFHSSECELCNIQFSAPIMSKMHYSGKQHMKKVGHFMEWWSLKTGTPIRRSKDPVSPANVVAPEYCEICDVEMLTLNEKILHISGKKHKKNLNDPTKCRKRPLHCSKMVKQDDKQLETFQTTEMLKKETEVAKSANKSFGCSIMASSEDKLVYPCNGEKHKEINRGFKIDKERPESSLTCRCIPCKMNFLSEQEMEKHKETNKHKLSLLNQEVGDRVIPGLELWYCMTCKAQYNGSKEYTEHLFKEKHMTLETNCASLRDNTDLFYCTVCDLLMDQEGKDGHMKDLEHRRKSLKNYSMKIITNMANTDDNTLYYSCPDCPDAGSMSFIEFNAHLLTHDHTERVLNRKQR